MKWDLKAKFSTPFQSWKYSQLDVACDVIYVRRNEYMLRKSSDDDVDKTKPPPPAIPYKCYNQILWKSRCNAGNVCANLISENTVKSLGVDIYMCTKYFATHHMHVRCIFGNFLNEHTHHTSNWYVFKSIFISRQRCHGCCWGITINLYVHEFVTNFWLPTRSSAPSPK